MAAGKLIPKGLKDKLAPRAIAVGDIVELKESVVPDRIYNYHSIPKGTVGLMIAAVPPKILLATSIESPGVYVPLSSCRLLSRPSKSRFEPFAYDPKNPNTLAGRTSTLTGSDPEIFVLDKAGVVIPAWEFLPTKEELAKKPQQWEAPRRTLATYVHPKLNCVAFKDGFQAEFTTIAGGCHDGHMAQIRYGLLEVYHKALAYDPKATLTHECVVEIPYEMMQGVSDENAALGCAPSLSAYGDPPLEVEPRSLGIRFAGCHMHMGGVLSPTAVERTVKTLDAIAGVMMVSLLEGLEDPRRRMFYGKAGEYRLPAHGLEWRVPSSAVLVHSTVTYFCFDFARQVRSIGIYGQGYNWTAKEQEVVEVINNLDIKGARRILERNRTMLQHILDRCYGRRPELMDLVLKGARHQFGTNIVHNWGLDYYDSSRASLNRVSNWSPKAWPKDEPADKKSKKEPMVNYKSSEPRVGLSAS